MLLFRLALPALLLSAPAPVVLAASFDCSAAATPFEHAICDNPVLSEADELLARTYATATGGLAPSSLTLMREDQRKWLAYAQRACTDTAEPLTAGRYDETGANCLSSTFSSRSSALEQSRMLAGHRFLVQGEYHVLPDPNETGNPDSLWPVATHEVTYPLLVADDALAPAFNSFITQRVEALAQTAVDDEAQNDYDTGADTSLAITIKEVVGANRITMETGSYWYGHGAAHGNYTLNFLHYFVPEEREVVAGDIFSGKRWSQTLVNAAWAQLQAEHGEALDISDPADIADLVVDPSRWDLSDDYGLVIQFQPYEVSAYAYGAPTIRVPWEKLEAIKADTQESVRFGY